MNNQIQSLWHWLESGKISRQQFKKALEKINYQPSLESWRQFFNKLLLVLGLASLVCGVVFFFAYNWDDLGREQKFLLIQGLIAVCGLGIFLTPHKGFLQAALGFSLMMLIGVLFAFFGQTYQTGKDPWELFFNWFLVTLPLPFVFRKAPHWVLSLILLNLSLSLYFDVNSQLWGVYLNSNWQIFIISLVNLVLSMILQFSFLRTNWVSNDWISSLALLGALFGFSFLAVNFLFETNEPAYWLLIYLAVMAWIFYQHKHKSLNLFVLSGWVLSAIVFAIAVLVRITGEDLKTIGFLIVALAISGLSTVGGRWLMQLNRESQVNQANQQEVNHESE